MSSERVLLARLGAERFAFPLAAISEVAEAPVIAPIALAPHGVAGQCIHRERLLPVIDAGALLGVPRTGGRGVLLLVDGDAGRMALWVDDVLDMVPIEAGQRRPLPQTGAASALLDGVVDLGDGIAALVAMDAMRAVMAARLTMEAA